MENENINARIEALRSNLKIAEKRGDATSYYEAEGEIVRLCFLLEAMRKENLKLAKQ
tara:strand:- start:356 stop:526 length:171 start_codon:yes stop_codon:yes gene_type:complete